MPQIIDGFCGEPHVDSNDTRIFNASLVGEGTYRTSIGGQCEVTLVDANTLSIADGEIVAQGTRYRVPKAEEVKIANGVSGMNRIDLLLLRYEVDSQANTEGCSWRIAQGIASSGTPEVPPYTEGNVLEGATLAEYPIAQININGLLPSDPVILADVYQPYPELCDSQSQGPKLIHSETKTMPDSTVSASFKLYKTPIGTYVARIGWTQDYIHRVGSKTVMFAIPDGVPIPPRNIATGYSPEGGKNVLYIDAKNRRLVLWMIYSVDYAEAATDLQLEWW